MRTHLAEGKEVTIGSRFSVGNRFAGDDGFKETGDIVILEGFLKGRQLGACDKADFNIIFQQKCEHLSNARHEMDWLRSDPMLEKGILFGGKFKGRIRDA